MNGENHHIIPRSIRPDLITDKDNIVRLTYREHYIAHLCLYKIYENDKENSSKMACAWAFMCKNTDGQHVSSHEFELARRHFNESISFLHKNNQKVIAHCKELGKKLKGIPLSEEHRAKLSAVKKGKHTKGHPCPEYLKKRFSEERKGKPTWNKGNHLTEEWKKKLAEAHKGKPGRKWSDDEKKSHSDKMKGHKGFTSGMRWWTNGKEQILSIECPYDGWRLGRLEHLRFAGENNPAFGRHWWNNGIEQKYQKECPGEGWQLGTLKKNKK